MRDRLAGLAAVDDGAAGGATGGRGCGVTLGFVVGKFYPPHRGHKHLIDAARRQVDRLVVMLCHHPSQRLSGELRQAWLEQIHPDCDVHLVPDELADDSRQWAAFTVAHLGRPPDVVFSSEAYGPVFAGLMGSRHVMVDQPRARRADLGHPRPGPPRSRTWTGSSRACGPTSSARVVLIGAESTGKTTLAAALAGRYATAWVPEYGREHWERKVAGLPMTGPLPAWSLAEFRAIAAEQQRREDAAARSANRVLFCDTNAFATGTWHERYLGTRDEETDAVGRADRGRPVPADGPRLPVRARRLAGRRGDPRLDARPVRRPAGHAGRAGSAVGRPRPSGE